MARALVTGATGFVGSHLVAHLLDAGAEVAILRREGSQAGRIAHLLPYVSEIQGDLNRIGEASRAIADFAPEVVFHLGWSGVDRAERHDPVRARRNIENSLGLLRSSARAGCTTWVGMGSQAEYGPRPGPIDEETPTRPRDRYGEAKVEACLRTQELAAELNVRFLWVRLFSTYGPGDHPSALIPYVINTLLRGERPALTLGTQRWDYLYVDDAAEAIGLMASTPTASGPFNLGSGQTWTIREVVEKLHDQIAPGSRPSFGTLPYGPDAIMHLQADIRRLTQATGWRPRVWLDEGLTLTVDSYRQERGLRPLLQAREGDR